MGKRQIGELEPFELVIAIMISDLASLPMQKLGIPILYGIIPIITLLILQTTITVLELKSELFCKIICGKPSILINQGKIDIKELRHQRLNFNDLMEELRLKGFYDINEVEYAVLETSGEISILPKTSKLPVTREDLNIKPPQDKLPIVLILDGKINFENLSLLKKNKAWLNKKLKAHNILNSTEVFVAILDSKGKFYFQVKD